ncbi:hypothetical protein [Amycolatopsis kentuckyensis]|uniref:hypothetical protein n=1 Tax=Amycolatopsis kentuckyensis TaxID=218823 RepID=UPI00356478A4
MTSRNTQKAARARARKTGESHTAAVRAVREQAAAGPPADKYGGHRFDYESLNDLFKCSDCGEYEVVARNDDGSITPCRGLPSYADDPERVYLLLTENPAKADGGTAWISGRIREGKTGRSVRFGWRNGRWIIESAPSVVDQLEDHVKTITALAHGAGLDGPRVLAFIKVQRLTAAEGQQVIADNYASYVEKYGEPR